MRVGYDAKRDDHERRAARLHDIAKALSDFIISTRARHVAVDDAAYGLAGRSGIVSAEPVANQPMP
jgi:hypothetical protein